MNKILEFLESKKNEEKTSRAFSLIHIISGLDNKDYLQILMRILEEDKYVTKEDFKNPLLTHELSLDMTTYSITRKGLRRLKKGGYEPKKEKIQLSRKEQLEELEHRNARNSLILGRWGILIAILSVIWFFTRLIWKFDLLTWQHLDP